MYEVLKHVYKLKVMECCILNSNYSVTFIFQDQECRRFLNVSGNMWFAAISFILR